MNLFDIIKNKDDWTIFEEGILKVSCSVFVKEETLYVLFQETSEKTDWLSNLNFLPRVKKYNMVLHKGFYHQYEIVKDYVISKVVSLLKDNMRIVVAGWSLGGALSQIAVQDIYYHTNIKPILITFGAPKASVNIRTKNYIKNCINEEESSEYMNRSDLVTLMPPGYWHIKPVWRKKFSFIGLFKPDIHHQDYSDVDTSNVWSE